MPFNAIPWSSSSPYHFLAIFRRHSLSFTHLRLDDIPVAARVLASTRALISLLFADTSRGGFFTLTRSSHENERKRRKEAATAAHTPHASGKKKKSINASRQLPREVPAPACLPICLPAYLPTCIPGSHRRGRHSTSFAKPAAGPRSAYHAQKSFFSFCT